MADDGRNEKDPLSEAFLNMFGGDESHQKPFQPEELYGEPIKRHEEPSSEIQEKFIEYCSEINALRADTRKLFLVREMYGQLYRRYTYPIETTDSTNFRTLDYASFGKKQDGSYFLSSIAHETGEDAFAESLDFLYHSGDYKRDLYMEADLYVPKDTLKLHLSYEPNGLSDILLRSYDTDHGEKRRIVALALNYLEEGAEVYLACENGSKLSMKITKGSTHAVVEVTNGEQKWGTLTVPLAQDKEELYKKFSNDELLNDPIGASFEADNTWREPSIVKECAIKWELTTSNS